MIQNIVKEKCQEHSEDIVAIDQNQKDLQKRAVKRDKKEIKHIQDSINQIKQLKYLLQQNRSRQLETNLENINKLSECFEQSKNFYLQQFEQICTSIKKQAQSIQNVEQDFMNKVESQQSNDYQVFLKFIKEEENNFKLNQSSFQKDINNLIQTLDQSELISKCIQILNQTFVIETIFEEDHQNEEIQNLNLLCEDHQENIILFDLSQERTSSKRFACQYCQDSYSPFTINHEIQQHRQQNMQNHASKLKNKINSISENFGTLKKDLIKSLDNANKILQNHYDEYQIKMDSFKKQMNQSWQEMSKEEIIKILLELSNLNNQSIYVDPLLNEYNYQDNQINEFIQDTVLCFQECQGSQFNKINGLISNLLIVDDIKSKKKTINKEVEGQSIIETIDQSLSNSIILELKQGDWIYQFVLNKLKIQLYIPTLFSNYLIQILIIILIIKSFTYNLIQSNSIKQIEFCRAIAFNKDNLIVVAVCNKQIKVFEFKQEYLKQTQLLSDIQMILEFQIL